VLGQVPPIARSTGSACGAVQVSDVINAAIVVSRTRFFDADTYVQTGWEWSFQASWGDLG
jgi:hypothetical protein